MAKEKNIVLIGFMACGKTFVSRELARRLNRERVSTDEMIEKIDGRMIPEIFAQSGEPRFREMEHEVVREIALRDGLVIDCGGGVAADERNLAALKENGTVFYLSVTPESVLRRTKGRTDRPLLNVVTPLEKIKELLAKRDPHYRKADFVLDSNEDNVGKVVDDIIYILKGRPHGA